MTASADRPAWLPGYFTDRLHAVLPDADRMVFRRIPIGWSMCGRAVVLDPALRRPCSVPCQRCVRLAGPQH
ncbi:hypothetical protein [Actinophytocola sediminis]